MWKKRWRRIFYVFLKIYFNEKVARKGKALFYYFLYFNLITLGFEEKVINREFISFAKGDFWSRRLGILG